MNQEGAGVPHRKHGQLHCQKLLAQVVHDVISSFTSLSAGLDLFAPQETDEVWSLIIQAKKRMYAQMSLMRYIFSCAQGQWSEGMQLLEAYGSFFHVTVQGSVTQDAKEKIAAGLWLMKKAAKHGGVLHFDDEKILLQGAQASPPFAVTQRDEAVLCLGQDAESVREGYGSYVWELLHHRQLRPILKEGPCSVAMHFLPA